MVSVLHVSKSAGHSVRRQRVQSKNMECVTDGRALLPRPNGARERDAGFQDVLAGEDA
jgi:hypothetical protein